jgi:hypothetical protein
VTSVGDTPKNTLNASVLSVERETTDDAVEGNIDERSDSEDNYGNEDLDDNIKCFEEILVEDDFMGEEDCDIDWGEITRRHCKQHGNRFEGIRF